MYTTSSVPELTARLVLLIPCIYVNRCPPGHRKPDLSLCGLSREVIFFRLLRDPELREHFRTDDAIAAFWKLRDDQRRELWGSSLDIAPEPHD